MLIEDASETASKLTAFLRKNSFDLIRLNEQSERFTQKTRAQRVNMVRFERASKSHHRIKLQITVAREQRANEKRIFVAQKRSKLERSSVGVCRPTRSEQGYI